MPTLFEDIDAQITAELAGRCILGVIVCARVDDAKDGVLYLNAHREPASSTEAYLNKNGLFLTASQSKTFTAVAALSLADRGLLNLDSELIDLLPDLKKHPDHSKLADVTVKDLLQHRAPLNWSREMYDQWDMGAPYPPVADISGPNLFPMLDTHRLDKGIGEPSYSNESYALLGAIIERVARENKLGTSFGDFVQKNLLEPNGLDKIYPGLSDEDIGKATNLVQGYYMMNDGTLKRSLKPSLLACTPSGGFYGTAEQVSKFYHLLMTGKILTEHSLEMMKEFPTIFWKGTGKAFPKGMGLRRYEDGSFGHDGVLTGYESRTIHKDGITISIMSNLCTLSDAYKPTQKDTKTPLFPKIVTIARDAIAKHYPDQKWTAEIPDVGSRVVVESQKPAK